MCLSTKIAAGKRKQYLKKRGNLIKVYKIVRSKSFTHKYIPECQGVYNLEFESGLNIDTATGKYIYIDNSYNMRYPKGFHAFTTKKGAQQWLGRYSHRKIVACYVKSSWVHTVGLQDRYGTVVVTKKIIMPMYDKLKPSQWLITRALNKDSKL